MQSFLRRLTSLVYGAQYQLLLLLLAAWASGYSLWALSHPWQLRGLFDNTLSHQERLVCAYYVLTALVLGAVAGAAHYLWRRIRGHDVDTAVKGIPWSRRWGLWGLPLALPFGISVFAPDIERTLPATTVILALLAALGFMAFLLALAWRTEPRRGQVALAAPGALRSAGRAWGPAACVFTLWCAYSWYFSYASIRSVQALRTRHWDLSIYNNLLYHTAHGDLLGASLVRGNTHTTAHFDPVLIPLAALYRLRPDMTFLLIVQALWCGLGVVPAYLLGKRVLKNAWAGVVVALSYALHPALQGANTNAFHSLTLIAVPLLWGWYWLETERYLRFLCFLPVIWAIREDAALVAIFMGASLLVPGHAAGLRGRTSRGDRIRVATGVATIALSAAYFLVVKVFFMASADVFMKGKGNYDYTEVFRYMIPNKQGMRDFLLTIVTNPVGTLRFAFGEEKIGYLFKMFGPFLFLPLVARRGRFVLAYGFLFLLLASKPSVCGTIAQYGLVAFPFLVGLLPSGVAALARSCGVFEGLAPGRRTFVILGAVLFASVVCMCKFGAIVPNKIVTTIPEVFDAEMEQRRLFIESTARGLPEKASVAASGTLLPFVSNRNDVYVLERRGVRPPQPADYLFVTYLGLTEPKRRETRKLVGNHAGYEVIADEWQVRLYRRLPREGSNPRKSPADVAEPGATEPEESEGADSDVAAPDAVGRGEAESEITEP